MFGGCPTEEALIQYAADPGSTRFDKHLAKCETCRTQVEQLRQNEKWLAEVRKASDDSVDARARRRIYDTCRRIAEEAKLPPKSPQHGATQPPPAR